MSSVNLSENHQNYIVSRTKKAMNLLCMSIDVDNSNHFHQSHNNQTESSSKRVKHLKPVLASASGEDQANEEAENADDACQVRFPHSLEDVNVKDCAQHSFQNANLRAQAERQQHREKQHRPEVSAGKFNNRLCEHDETANSD